MSSKPVSQIQQILDTLTRIEARQDAGDARLIDTKLENTILFGIGNEEHDANTTQIDAILRQLTRIEKRILRLEERLSPILSDPIDPGSPRAILATELLMTMRDLEARVKLIEDANDE